MRGHLGGRVEHRRVHIEAAMVVEAEALGDAHHLVRLLELLGQDQSTRAMLAVPSDLHLVGLLVVDGRLVAGERFSGGGDLASALGVQVAGDVPAKRALGARADQGVLHLKKLAALEGAMPLRRYLVIVMRGKGAIAAGHPLTAAVGAGVLENGGNAVDAAIAAAFASFVTESPLTGPGGGGFMLVHDQGHEELIDFFVAVPGLGARRERPEPQILEILFGGTTPVRYFVGGPAVAVPGMLAGLWAAHVRHGSLPWAELIAPAIDLARQGVEVTTAQAYIQRIVEPILRATDFGRHIYGEDRLVDAGETLQMAELAATLELAQSGVDSFYRGELAREIVSYLAERQGLITLADLAAYEVVIRKPTRTRYRDYDFITNPPPSSGGLLVAHTLSLLDRVGVKPGVAGLRSIAEALRASSAKRAGDFYAGLYGDSLADLLLDPARLDQESRALVRVLAGHASDPVHESPSSPSTTHLSVIDSAGRAASLTASTGAATGMFVPSLGLSLNNMLGEADLLPYALDETDPDGASLQAGTRLTSMMSPSLLKHEGEVRLVLGSAGASRLRSAIVQVVANVVDHGLPLQAALEQPRLHLEGDVLHLESGFAPADVAQLERAGYQLNLWPGLDFYFGGAAAVAVGEDGFEAAGDSRRGGAGLVVNG